MQRAPLSEGTVVIAHAGVGREGNAILIDAWAKGTCIRDAVTLSWRICAQARVLLASPTRLNETWTIDSLKDALANGRESRTPSIEYTVIRDMLAIEVDTSLPAFHRRRIRSENCRPGELRNWPPSVRFIGFHVTFTANSHKLGSSVFWSSGCIFSVLARSPVRLLDIPGIERLISRLRPTFSPIGFA